MSAISPSATKFTVTDKANLLTAAANIRYAYATKKKPADADKQSFKDLASKSPYRSLKDAIDNKPKNAAIQLAELAIFQTTPNAATIIKNIREATCETDERDPKALIITLLNIALNLSDSTQENYSSEFAQKNWANLRTIDALKPMMQHLPENDFSAVGYQILATCLQNPNVPPAAPDVLANIQQLLEDLKPRPLETTESGQWLVMGITPTAPPSPLNTGYASTGYALRTGSTAWSDTAPSGSRPPSIDAARSVSDGTPESLDPMTRPCTPLKPSEPNTPSTITSADFTGFATPEYVTPLNTGTPNTPRLRQN